MASHARLLPPEHSPPSSWTTSPVREGIVCRCVYRLDCQEVRARKMLPKVIEEDITVVCDNTEGKRLGLLRQDHIRLSKRSGIGAPE